MHSRTIDPRIDLSFDCVQDGFGTIRSNITATFSLCSQPLTLMSSTIRQGVLDDLPVVVQLCNDNVRSKVDIKQGFLQGGISPAMLEKWITNKQLYVITLDDTTPKGFACVSDPTLSGSPVIKYIVDNSDKITFKNRSLQDYNFRFYGPAVLDIEVRGKGLIKKLFRELVRLNSCDLFVAFVDNDNQKSLDVHLLGLKFEVIETVTIGDRSFTIIAYDLNQSRL